MYLERRGEEPGSNMKELSPIDTNCQPDEMAVDKLYTIEETAELLKMSPRGIRDWIQKKKIKAFKLPDGKKWVIHEEDIQAMIDKGRKGE